MQVQNVLELIFHIKYENYINYDYIVNEVGVVNISG